MYSHNQDKHINHPPKFPCASLQHLPPTPSLCLGRLRSVFRSCGLYVLEFYIKESYGMHSFYLFFGLAFSIIIIEIYHVEYINILLLFMAGLYPSVWIYYNLFIHSPIDEHLGFIFSFVLL